MNRSSIRPCILLLLTSALLPAQSARRASRTLMDRFEKLSCAVVQIQTGNETGTAFFISADGDLVTAAHVVFEKMFGTAGNLQVLLTITRKPNLRITSGAASGTEVPLLPLTILDVDRAVQDVALLKTTIRPECYLPIGDS